jgi:hypothetical protein
MEFTKPLFMRMKTLSDEALETIINTMWPDTPTIEDKADIDVARTRAKKFFQAYRCNLNNELAHHSDLIIKRFLEEK